MLNGSSDSVESVMAITALEGAGNSIAEYNTYIVEV